MAEPLSEKQQPADDTVAGAFSKCQQTVACHKKYCLALQRQRAQDPAAFAVEFKGCLNSILTVFKREPAVRPRPPRPPPAARCPAPPRSATSAVSLMRSLLPP